MRDDETLTFVPDDGGVSGELSPSSNFFWKDQDGMGALSTDIFTNTGWRDGATVTGKRRATRTITITGQLRTDLDDYDALRESLLRIFRPGREGKLVYENALYTRYIPCIVQSSPEPSRGIFPEADIEFFCASPFWRGGDGTGKQLAQIASLVNNLVFPFVFVEEGSVFGYRAPSLVTNIINTGDEELPLTIEFDVTAAVSDLKITNIQTQDYLLVEGDFLAGDKVTVETDDDLITATLLRGGVETNIFNQVPEEATWLKLAVGDNYLRAEASNDDNVNVSIWFDDMLYTGV